MSEELKPLACPFCGGTSPAVHRTGSYMTCASCLADGPLIDDVGTALGAWNRRAQPAWAIDHPDLAARFASEDALAALTAEQERLGLYEQPAAPALTPCRGLQDSTCTYLATCGGICNKCGKSHDGKANASLPFAAAPSVAPEPVAGNEDAAKPIEWRDVVGYEGFYEVSSIGHIRNKRTGKIHGVRKTGSGYVRVNLVVKGERHQFAAHRLVAIAFLGDRSELEVNHKNGVKMDNRVENLEWVTRSENELHSRYSLGNLVKPIIALNKATGERKRFASINACKAEGFCDRHVVSCCLGRRLTHKGWRFAFEDSGHAFIHKVSKSHPPRTPLTNAEIDEFGNGINGIHPLPSRREVNRRLARLVERAHGISAEGEKV